MTDRPTTASGLVVDLTRRQQQVLAALRRMHERDGYSPSLRELADEVGLASPSTVLGHVRVLERAGIVERRPGQPRTAKLIRP